MRHLPEIDPQFVRLMSEETREEIARQSRDPWGSAALKVLYAVLALVVLAVVVYPVWETLK